MSQVHHESYKRHKTIDRISNMPQNVTQLLLECLPLHEAVRTSVLSSDWRFKWVSISQLTLNKQFFERILHRNSFDFKVLECSYVVNDILVNYIGPISKLVLWLPSLQLRLDDGINESDWIRYVHAKGIKELILNDDCNRGIPMPTCLFTCVGLTHLTIIKHELYFDIPRTFEGFPCLVSLKMEVATSRCYCQVTVQLENFISKCPQLASLSIKILEWNFHLKIRAPKLQDLFVSALLENISSEGITSLKSLTLDVVGCLGWKYSSRVANFFSCLPNIEKLNLFWTEKSVYALTFLKKLPKDLERLRTLKLVGIPLYCNPTISFVLCLFRSSPNLNRLCIQTSRYDVLYDKASIQIDHSVILKCLKHVQLLGFKGKRSELQFIQYLLASSHALEKITVELRQAWHRADDTISIAKAEIMRYPRASPNAVIILDINGENQVL